MKIKDLKNLSDDELVIKEKQIKKDLFDLNNQRQLGRVEKPANARNFRRDIARILTVLNERKNNGNRK
jgi:large subunit ribosomal protein L29